MNRGKKLAQMFRGESIIVWKRGLKKKGETTEYQLWLSDKTMATLISESSFSKHVGRIL